MTFVTIPQTDLLTNQSNSIIIY